MQDQTLHHQSDSDALASALGAIGASTNNDPTAHQFEDYTSHTPHDDHDLKDGEDEVDVDVVDVSGLEDVNEDLDLSVLAAGDLDGGASGFDRPPSIRKGEWLRHQWEAY